MVSAVIEGCGIYVPGEPIGNSELKTLAHIDFDSERTEKKIGIAARHNARLRGLDETTADFATRAVEAAIASAGITASDIDLFVVGTDTPEYVSPATAILVQGRIQGSERSACSFDVGASCASFVTAFDAASRMVANDPFLRHAVVIGVYNMTAHLREGDGFGYSLFADGAGAVVLGKSETAAAGVLGSRFVTDGTQWDYIGVYTGGTRKPISGEVLETGEYGLQLLKKLPGDRNVKLWPPLVRTLVESYGKSVQDIDHILFTQINRSVIEEVMGILDLPMEKTTTVMDRYGYTGSACIPMAFYHAVAEKRIKRGDLVVWVASGAGLAVGANMFVY